MKRTISILGCGWLGTLLGKQLLYKRYVVKGSTQSMEGYNKLEPSGIQSYFMTVSADSISIDFANFFNTDVLVIALPPARIDDIETVFPKQINQIINYIRKVAIKKVIFISSTSVYESRNVEVREGDEGYPEKASGRALLKAEALIQNLEGVDTTILRFGGLIGERRNPASFLRGKVNTPGDIPVNLINSDDCIDIIINIIEQDVWGEVFNACSPGHPTKEEFYSKAAQISDLPVPQFSDKPQKYKAVNSDKLIDRLDYEFHYPSPMDYLKELEEWTYNI